MLVKVFNIKYATLAEDAPNKKLLVIDNGQAITKEFVKEELTKNSQYQIEDFEYEISQDRIFDVDEYAYWLHKSDCFKVKE